jgi:hypothetical protein
MTIAERQAIADATENCRRLTLELADLRRRVEDLETVEALHAQALQQRPTLSLKDRTRG